MLKHQFAAGIAVALASACAFMNSTPAVAATSTSAPRAVGAAVTQAFTGSGKGFYDVSFRDEPTFSGGYTSTGQLGSGHLLIDTGLNPFATFTRSDGMRVSTSVVDSVPTECSPGDPTVECIRVDMTGTGDVASAHVVIAATLGAITGEGYATTFALRGTLTLNHRIGYAMLGANGTVYGFGGVDRLGDAPTAHATDLERLPWGNGYWVVDGSGHVYAFGDAPYLGNAPTTTFAPGETVTSMSATPTGWGYWLFTSRGRVFAFGDARRFGDLRSVPLNGPIIGSVATPTGAGYYMVGSDGGVFAFGDARFRGSMGGTRLNRPVVGLVPTADNSGYWLVASDGGVFSFGDARFFGSMGGTKLNRPIVTMVRYGTAYLMVASDGGVFNFSHAPFFGSLGGTAIAAPVVSGAATS